MASFLEKDFGQKVKLPPWQRLDPSQIQLDTVTGNTGVLPSSIELGQQVNNYTMDELERLYGFSEKTFRQISDNIAAEARGEIPKDVQDLLQTNAATKSLYGGYGGSQAARNLTARDFGLTSMGIKSKGLDSATRWLQSLRSNTFDVTSMFLKPEQRYGIAANERDLAFKYDYLKAQIAAAPDPAIRGLMDAVRNGSMYMSGGWNGTYQTPQVGNQGSVSNGGYFAGGGSAGGGGNMGWESQTGASPVSSGAYDWNANFGSQFAGYG